MTTHLGTGNMQHEKAKNLDWIFDVKEMPIINA
jgi:hypothetical protein